MLCLHHSGCGAEDSLRPARRQSTGRAEDHRSHRGRLATRKRDLRVDCSALRPRPIQAPPHPQEEASRQCCPTSGDGKRFLIGRVSGSDVIRKFHPKLGDLRLRVGAWRVGAWRVAEARSAWRVRAWGARCAVQASSFTAGLSPFSLLAGEHAPHGAPQAPLRRPTARLWRVFERLGRGKVLGDPHRSRPRCMIDPPVPRAPRAGQDVRLGGNGGHCADPSVAV